MNENIEPTALDECEIVDELGLHRKVRVRVEPADDLAEGNRILRSKCRAGDGEVEIRELEERFGDVPQLDLDESELPGLRDKEAVDLTIPGLPPAIEAEGEPLSPHPPAAEALREVLIHPPFELEPAPGTDRAWFQGREGR